MLSKIFKISFSKIQFNKLFSTTKLQDNVIDLLKFDENYLMVYDSKETTKFRLLSFGLFYFGAFFGYQYYQGNESIFTSIEGRISILSFLVMFGLEYKLRRTLKNVWLYRDGYTVELDTFKWFGISSKRLYLETTNFGGVRPFLHKVVRMPAVKYLDVSGKKNLLFFKAGYSAEQEILKKMFYGETFKVADKDMAINLSKKSKNKYGL